jgi:hypothetical protein
MPTTARDEGMETRVSSRIRPRKPGGHLLSQMVARIKLYIPLPVSFAV